MRHPSLRRIVSNGALLIGVLLFLRVTVMYLLSTGNAAHRTGLQAIAPNGIASLRTLAGGFHLGLAFVAILGLVYRRFATSALACMLIVTATVASVRWSEYALLGTIALTPAITELFAVLLFAVGLAASLPARSSSAELDP